MGRFKDMVRDRSSDRGADSYCHHRLSDPDETVRHGEDKSVDPYGKDDIGNPKNGPGFRSVPWGRDDD